MTEQTTSVTARDERGGAPVLDALVIGGGFAGLGMLYQLQQNGFSSRVVEAGGDVGGTWYWNRYPGCKCDSPSEVYQYFFSEELLQDWTWKYKYPTQPEILSYLQHVADRFDLRRHITFNTRVIGARFDESRQTWVSRLDTGEQIESRFLITACGCLSAAQVPDFPGIDDFAGEWHHTSDWPEGGVDFTGKRVGVIGTGSTGVQISPVIAESAQHLTVFQRTPNYIFPARQRDLTDDEIAEMKSSWDAIHTQIRSAKLGQRFAQKPGSALDVPDDERRRFYQESWDEGNAVLLFSGWEDIFTNPDANETAAAFVREKIGERVDDPGTRELLTPRDHYLGTKRPPLDTEYFEMFNRDNVSLVDVRTNPIDSITEAGLRLRVGNSGEYVEHELDVIVFATGFDAVTGPLLAMDIRGRNDLTLQALWKDGPSTYLGVSMAGFPNLFTITGPGSPAVISNMPTAIEQHFEWIRDCLIYLRENGKHVIEADPIAQEEWDVRVADVAAGTLMVTADSWYMGANVEGKPRKFMAYLGGIDTYGEIIERVADEGYPGFHLS